MNLKKFFIFLYITISTTNQLTPQIGSAPNPMISLPNGGYYNRAIKMAEFNNQTYVGIVEYSAPVTPPNATNPQLTMFATIPTPGYKPQPEPIKPHHRIIGGEGPTTKLYGILVHGSKIAVNNQPMDGSMIGFYWPSSNIAQLNDGTTYVDAAAFHEGIELKADASALQSYGITIPHNHYALRNVFGSDEATDQKLLGINLQNSDRNMIPRKTTSHDQTHYNPSNAQFDIASTLKDQSQETGTTITGVQGGRGMYDSSSNTAWIQDHDGSKTHYEDVVEYSQAVTPPNVYDHDLVLFATMPNSKFTGKSMPGGQMRNISLYGKEIVKTPHDTDNTPITGLNGDQGMYDSKSSTAWLYDSSTQKRSYYSHVTLQTNAGTTPPSLMNKKLKMFATMPNKVWQQPPAHWVGGPLKEFMLWGIPVVTTGFLAETPKQQTTSRQSATQELMQARNLLKTYK